MLVKSFRSNQLVDFIYYVGEYMQRYHDEKKIQEFYENVTKARRYKPKSNMNLAEKFYP